MKATINKLLRSCIPIIIVSVLLAATVFGAESTDPGDTWWSLDMETGILSVQTDIRNYDNTVDFYPPWHKWSSAIREVQISEGVEHIGQFAFSMCENITSVTLPSTLRSIGDYAFGACERLTVVHIPVKVESISSNSFAEARSLTTFVVDKDNPYFVSDEQGALYNKDRTMLLTCPGGFIGTFKIPQSVKSLREYSFGYCTKLTEVLFSEGVTRIGQNAFLGCIGLTRISLPDSVKTVEEYAFFLCENLKTVDLAKSSLYSVNAFSDCLALERITVAKDSEYYTCDEQGALYDKEMSAILLCPAGFRGHFTIPQGVSEIAYSAFATCQGLTGVNIPDGITLVGEEAFRYCTRLEEITLPYSLKHIGNMAFMGCGSLKTVSIPDNIMTMGWDIFYDCKSLVSVYFPSIHVPIEKLCFLECPNLKAIYFRGPAPYIYDEEVKIEIPEGVTLYYLYGQSGWTSPTWKGYNTEIWSGMIMTDVKVTDYFYEPVQWALTKKITNGVGKDLFLPENVCTRGQVVTFLWRANGCPEPMSINNPFTDISPEAYYYKAVLWALEEGITNGIKEDIFAPEAGCTRGQVVTFLWRANGKPEIEKAKDPFTDVPEDTYYTQAVLWAVEQGITTGKTTDIFAPEDLCTRGQIVTFLWRGRDLIPNPYIPYYTVLRDIQEACDSPLGRGMFYDLDGNGTEELIINYYYQGEHCLVYTIEDGNAVPLLEDHVYAVPVGGGRGGMGLAEMDGKLYLYTMSIGYDMEHDDVYGAMDWWGMTWKFYLPSEEGLALAIEVSLDYYMAYDHDKMEWYPVFDKIIFEINGEQKPAETFEEWTTGVNMVAKYDTNSEDLYPLGDLHSICKP